VQPLSDGPFAARTGRPPPATYYWSICGSRNDSPEAHSKQLESLGKNPLMRCGMRPVPITLIRLFRRHVSLHLHAALRQFSVTLARIATDQRGLTWLNDRTNEPPT